jgi:hypothetical protein
MLGPLDTESIDFRLQFAGGASEDPTNDYSYMLATGTDYQVNNHIVVVQGAGIAWGVEPPP